MIKVEKPTDGRMLTALLSWAPLLILVAVSIGVWSLIRLPLSPQISGLAELVQTLEAATNELIVLGAGVFFLVSLERRIKHPAVGEISKEARRELFG